MTPPRYSRIRMFRFFQLQRPSRANPPGWYWHEVNEYGYSLGTRVGPFPSYDAAFLAAGEDSSMLTSSPAVHVKEGVSP